MIKIVDGEPVEMTPEEEAEFLARQETPAPVPASVSPRQAKLALLDAGLLDEVEAAISSAERSTQIAWNDALEFRRDDPVVIGIGFSLGLSSVQVDDLFRAAALL